MFHRTFAPSTLGSFLREFQFGHVRQLDAVASRARQGLASHAPVLQVRDGERVMVHLDDTITEVHGYQKQGAGFGFSGVRGLNALIATASTSSSAPVILSQRLRQGKTGSPERRGADRRRRSLATLRRTGTAVGARPLPRADSAFYGHAEIRDEITGQLISTAEVAEIPFTAFRSRKKAERVTKRLIVRRIADLNPEQIEQPTLEPLNVMPPGYDRPGRRASGHASPPREPQVA